MIANEVVFVDEIFSEDHWKPVNGRILLVLFLCPWSHIPFLEKLMIFILILSWSIAVAIVS